MGEECTEVIIAGKADDKAETVCKIADLAYHLLVLMAQMGITVGDIRTELASRHIIDHKVKQENMTKSYYPGGSLACPDIVRRKNPGYLSVFGKYFVRSAKKSENTLQKCVLR